MRVREACVYQNKDEITNYLNCSGESVASERKEQKEFSNSDVVEDVEGLVDLGFLPRLGCGRDLVLVHEHCDPDDDEKDEEVLQHRVSLPAEQNAEDHDRNRLTRFADNLKSYISMDRSILWKISASKWQWKGEKIPHSNNIWKSQRSLSWFGQTLLKMEIFHDISNSKIHFENKI